LTERFETYYWVAVSQAQREAATERVRPAEAFEEEVPCDNYNPPDEGLIELSGTINPDGTGTVNLNYKKCELAGSTTNGQATVRIDAFDLGYGVFTDWTFTTSNLTGTDAYTNWTLSGSIRNQADISSNAETVTFNFVITDNLSDEQIKTQNLVFAFVYNDFFNRSACTLDIMGRVYDSVYGYVGVSKVVSWVFDDISQMFPNSGYHALTGANSAHIGVTALSAVLVTVQLDLDGDGVYELMATLPWEDIWGPIVFS